jgi:hypothetical protein
MYWHTIGIFNSIMKHIYFFIACLILVFTANAEKGPKAVASKMMASKGSLQLKFHATVSADAAANDSVLVIFDRFDHSGAGVVYQIFYPNSDNSITIPAIPEGKYYVTIQGLGLHRDRIETVIKIKSQKSEILKINQDDSEVFSKDKVVIPAYHPDFSNLGVATTK